MTPHFDRVREALSEFWATCCRILSDADRSLADRFVLDDMTPVDDGEGDVITARDSAVADLHDITADRDWRLEREWRRVMRALRDDQN